MIAEGYRIYLATRKRNDQLFNRYFMRPLAGVAVAVLARTPITPNWTGYSLAMGAEKWHYALHEIIGFWAYRLTGRI